MSALLRLIKLIPNSGKYVMILMIFLGLSVFVYMRWGLMPAIFVVGAVFVVFLAVVIYNRAVKVKQRQDGLAFGKALDAANRGPSREELRSAVSDLSQKWQEALQNLKAHRIDIYQLPWYMLIGEPQSGKSTTLKFSGLRFPIGSDSISGGGGTRNCDWWFTEQGVILDTAGRFTFQESTATDAAEWTHFLGLLARYRPYCPINGVILVIPTDALLSDDKATLEQKANNISEKMLHIQRQLAIQFPIYVLITKCDQIYGFTQFFNKLNADQQREMFGWSNPVESAGFDSATFEQSFGEIANRIGRIRMNHLSQPHFIDDIDKTFVFPEEFRAIRDPLKHYMEAIFKPSVYKDPLFFRGYYFSSGMQEGQPIVKACSNMLRDGSMLEKLENIFQKSRAFFVRDFYTEKVFPEEGLVRRAYQYVKRDKLKRRMIWGMNAAMFVLGCLFLWMVSRNLTQRLDTPKRAIDTANQQLRTNTATFFDGASDRELIFSTLKNLKSGIRQDRSFLLMLRSRQNALTAHLQDAFAYFFLDRIMIGLMDRVNGQLSAFRLSGPSDGLTSFERLDLLLAALSELKKWRLKTAEGHPDDFSPTIQHFLGIAADPSWDHELAAHRGDRRVADILESWFQEVYARASPRVRAYLIEETVRRSRGLYSELHHRIADFYRSQPELLNYQKKAQLLTELTAAYERIQDPPVSQEEYGDALTAMADYFSEENQAVMKAYPGGYLSFDAIRDKTIAALGPAFESLKPGPDGVINPSGRGQKERDFLPETVTFVNQLLAIRVPPPPSQTSEPPTGETVESSAYPTHLWDFWQKILEPYTRNIRKEDAYSGVPDEAKSFDENLTDLFGAGSDRIGLIKRTFEANMFAHAETMTEERKRRRFEQAMTGFHDYLVTHEQDQVASRMKLLVAGQIENAPSPPGSWSKLTQAFNQHSQGGRAFDAFTRGPASLSKKLTDNHLRELRTIYFNSDPPTRRIDDYIQTMHAQLRDYGQTLNDLAQISDRELAGNKSRYLGSFPAAAQLQQLGKSAKAPDFMVSHQASLAAWADAALDAFRARVRGADPCPECKQAFQDLLRAYQEAGGGFPMDFNGQLSLTEAAPGVVDIGVRLVPEDKLTALLRNIEMYREPESKLRKNIVEDLGLGDFIRDALVWANGVTKLRAGMEIFFQVRELEGSATNLKSLTTEFTFGELSGSLSSQKLNLNSPRLLQITKNPTAENEITRLRFYNDSQGNRTESILRIQNSYMGLIAFALNGASPNSGSDYFIKHIVLPLNTGTGKVDGAFHLRLSAPLPPPPDWKRLGN